MTTNYTTKNYFNIANYLSHLPKTSHKFIYKSISLRSFLYKFLFVATIIYNTKKIEGRTVSPDPHINLGLEELNFIEQVADTCVYRPDLCKILSGIVQDSQPSQETHRQQAPIIPSVPDLDANYRAIRTPEADLIRLQAQARLMKQRLRNRRNKQRYGLKYKGLG